MKLVVTIPAFNESATIAHVISGISGVLRKLSYRSEILVVDDGSTDNTTQVARDCGAVVFSHPKNYGLGETFRTEVEKALERKADFIVHIDADGQYRAQDIPLLLKEIEGGADLVLGSRFKGRIEGMPFVKRLGNHLFSLLVSYITKLPVSDAQTGFRAFNKRVAQEAKITSSFTYTQDQIIVCSRKKFVIREVPVFFLRREGSSRLMKGPVDYGLRAGTNLIRLFRDYAPITFFGSIGLAFIVPGLLLGFWLAMRYLTLGYIGKTPTLILSVFLVLLGIQFILFGFFADARRK